MKLFSLSVLKNFTIFSLFFLITSCSSDFEIDLDGCNFYSYINIAPSCKCVEGIELYCFPRFYQLDEDEFNRINIIFNKSEQQCIEISGKDFVGKPFSGYAKRPFVDYCHKWIDDVLYSF